MRGVATIAAIAITGCSFAFVSGPPPNHAEVPYFDCSESRVMPILDSVLAGVTGLVAINAATKTDTQWHDLYCMAGDTTCQPPTDRVAAIALYSVFALIGAASAVDGYVLTSQCRDARDQLRHRAAQHAPGPPGAVPAPAVTPPAVPPTGS